MSDGKTGKASKGGHEETAIGGSTFRTGACPICGRTDVLLRAGSNELTLHDRPDGVACNLATRARESEGAVAALKKRANKVAAEYIRASGARRLTLAFEIAHDRHGNRAAALALLVYIALREKNAEAADSFLEAMIKEGSYAAFAR